MAVILITNICYSQMIPYKASITPSKDAVSSSETFTVTYKLSEVEGYVYIGIEDLYFEILGTDRWEGYINEGETANIAITLKFKEKFKPYLYSKKIPIGIGFSYHPFGERIGEKGEFTSILITISDFDDFKQDEKGLLKDNIDQSDSSSQKLDLYLIPYDTIIPRLRKEIVPDTNSPRLE